MPALVIEGGGMRAAYSNGVLAAFEDAGHHPWDAVYGTSAGGALAGWYSAGQARYALGTWHYADDPRILSYGRWLTFRGPLLDHDALFRIVYEDECPLDVQAIRDAEHPVIVTVTNADTGELRYVDVRAGPVLAWLRATGRLPLAAGPPVEIDGERWLDGGIVDPVPLARAIEDGHTDITLVLNRARGNRKPEPRLVDAIVSRKYPALAGLVRDHHEIHARAQRLIERAPPGVELRVVRPSDDVGLNRLTRDLDALDEGMLRGLADGAEHLADVVGEDAAQRVVHEVPTTAPVAGIGEGVPASSA